MITETPTEAWFAACRRDDRDILPSSAQRDAASTAQPWTATRCHRLLRPLLSHLAALRKAEARLATGGDGPQQPESEPPSLLPASRKRVRYTYSLKGVKKRRLQADRPSEAAARRPVSGGVQADGKLQEKQQQQLADRYTCPGEVVVPTPVLNRATKRKRSLSVPSSPIERHTATLAVEAARAKLSTSASSAGSRSAMKDEWARLRTATPTECHQLYESIFRAVDALLRATSATPSQPRSLLAMCLRQVPQYTAAYEAQERHEALQRGDAPPAASQVSFSVYSDLESLGHGAAGWPHLRAVVRAHAIDLVGAACADGLLRPAFVRLLVRFLARVQAYDEAEDLLRAALRQRDIPAPADGIDSVFSETDASLYALRLLAEYAEETGRWSCLFQQLTALLESGRLPCAWLATRALRSVWQRVVRMSSSSGTGTGVRRASLDFATAAITRLVYAQPAAEAAVGPARPEDGVDGHERRLRDLPLKAYPTLVSVLGSLVAVAILQQEAAAANGADRDTEVPGQKQLAILVAACLGGKSGPSRRGRKKKTSAEEQQSIAAKRLIIGLARFLSGIHGDEHDSLADFESAGAEQRKQLYDAALTLIVSVAQSCGRGAATTAEAKPGRVYLAELCAQAVDPLAGCFSADDEVARDEMVRQMLADGAFLLASRTNDLRDLAFAESFGISGLSRRLPFCPRATSTTTSPAVPKPSSGPATPTALFAGYRWEEGISEWVIASPKTKCKRPQQPVGRQLWASLDRQKTAPGSEDEDEDQDQDDLHVPHRQPRRQPVTMRRSTSPEWHSSTTKRRRHSRHSWPSQEDGRREGRERRTILSLVSDDENETGDEDSYDEISLSHAAAPRQRRRRVAPRTSLPAMDEASDDELCL